MCVCVLRISRFFTSAFTLKICLLDHLMMIIAEEGFHSKYPIFSFLFFRGSFVCLVRLLAFCLVVCLLFFFVLSNESSHKVVFFSSKVPVGSPSRGGDVMVYV